MHQVSQKRRKRTENIQRSNGQKLLKMIFKNNAPIAHKECKHYALQTCIKNKGIQSVGEAGVGKGCSAQVPPPHEERKHVLNVCNLTLHKKPYASRSTNQKRSKTQKDPPCLHHYFNC